MLMLLLYVLGAVITVTHSAYKTGQEQARLKTVEPTSFAVVNYLNNLAMVPIWFMYWVAMYGRYSVRKETRMEAGRGLGIPPERL